MEKEKRFRVLIKAARIVLGDEESKLNSILIRLNAATNLLKIADGMESLEKEHKFYFLENMNYISYKLRELNNMLSSNKIIIDKLLENTKCRDQ